MNAETYLTARRDDFLTDFLDLLRIPSISALPEHDADIHRAAEWVRDRLIRAGLKNSAVMETGGHPAVYADSCGSPGRPTVLIYGHYDVQPPDPLDLWDTPAFQPAIRDGRVYGRGASDMKGNLLTSIIGVEASLQDGPLPVNVKFLIEGQEEILSPQMPAFIAANGDLLACDAVFSGDGLQWSEEQPCLVVGMRGACGIEIDVTGPDVDVHSGLYGGAIANPIHALARIITSMRDAGGRILVEGFLDGVSPPTADERAEMTAVPFDERAFLNMVGVQDPWGEDGFSTLERLWVRPSLEVNGMWGGFQGDGMKTIIPAEAHAKITCRLVPGQIPASIRGCLIDHIAKQSPPGVQVSARPLVGEGDPMLFQADAPAMRAAAGALTELYGRSPVKVRFGASIPITTLFRKHLGCDTVVFGFGLEDECAHSPNEFMRLSSFDRAQRAWVLALRRLGDTPG